MLVEEFWEEDELYENPHSLEDIHNSIMNDKPYDFIKKVYLEDESFFGWWICPSIIVKGKDNQTIGAHGIYFSKQDEKIIATFPSYYKDDKMDLDVHIYIYDTYAHKKFALDYRAGHWIHKAGIEEPVHVFVSCGCGQQDCELSGEYFYKNDCNYYLEPTIEEIPLLKVYITVEKNDSWEL